MNSKILLFIVEKAECRYIDSLSKSTLKVGEDTYNELFKSTPHAQRYDGFLGFYDWLVNKDNEIIGVYLSLADFSEKLLDCVRSCHSVDVEEDFPAIYFFFGQSREYLIELSVSQSFGENRAYSTVDGKIAISFELPPTEYRMAVTTN